MTPEDVSASWVQVRAIAAGITAEQLVELRDALAAAAPTPIVQAQVEAVESLLDFLGAVAYVDGGEGAEDEAISTAPLLCVVPPYEP